MSLFVISDLHLSLSVNKSMHLFGGKWLNYINKIEKLWKATITNDDTVVIGGDISWGINFNEALNDFYFIDKLPGKKIILKGNHDLWWKTVKKINEFFIKNNIYSISLLYNNSYIYKNNIIICGTRGWLYNYNLTEEQNNKIFIRERLRLENSLSYINNNLLEKICFFHYPPIYSSDFKNIFLLLEKYNVQKCYYGHIHGEYINNSNIIYDKMSFILTSSDFLNFKPLLVKL